MDLPPLTGTERRRALWKLAMADHGIFRQIYLNLHRVDDRVWRSAQPAPWHLTRFKDRGFKTILNLRSSTPTNPRYRLEREACDALGLELVSFNVMSRSLLEPERVLEAVDIWNRLTPPILMHCKSGADRTGFMSTLYLWQYAGVPLPQATGQLSWRYGHIRRSKTGVLDYFFERYAARNAETGIGFRDWVSNEYDPTALKAEFRGSSTLGDIADTLLRRE